MNRKFVSSQTQKENPLSDPVQSINDIYAAMQEAVETSYEISFTTLGEVLKDLLFTSGSEVHIYNLLDETSRSKLDFIAWTLSENGCADGLIALFKQGLPVDLIQEDLETSFLINAVQANDAGLVQYLKDHQAPIAHTTFLGTTAKSLAEDNGYTDIVAILNS